MNFHDLATQVLTQLGTPDLPSAALDQLLTAAVKSTEITGGGGFADLETSSVQRVLEYGNGNFAVIRTLTASSEIGNAILHFHDGRIQNLEIWFYDPNTTAEQLSAVTLK